MDEVTVLLVEPDPIRLTHFERYLAQEAGLLLISQPDFFSENTNLPAAPHYDVLLLDADRTPVTDRRSWAKIHILLVDVRIVALTAGNDDVILEAVLAGGISGVHRITVEPAALCRVVRHAARGILDSDRELIDRARRVILQPLNDAQGRFGGLTIDLQAQRVTRWNKPVHLTPLEFKVLAYLARQTGQPTCLNELLTTVWSAPPEQGGTVAQVHNCIKRLLQKIEPDPQHPRYLLSERGWGYYLQDPAARAVTYRLSPADLHEDAALPELIDN
ncbi:MAG TPA: winged helix-turn-helix domain-containing protein [Anaerolineae bacterium]|nr:winged helix-turn-helix domain-containing protein [Anaerolineae bacterium]